MLEKYQEKQPLFYKNIEKIIKNNKISHAYMIETNGVSYGFDIALALSKTFLCPNNFLDNKNCNNCPICLNIEKGNYPDLKIIEADGKNIKKEQLLELQQAFKLKNLYGKYLIYIIKDAKYLNKSSANTILKFLEEPSENIIGILLVDNVYNCLDTIVSRCQILSLKNTDNKNYEKIFQKYNDQDNIDNFINEQKSLIISFYVDLETYNNKIIAYGNPYIYKDKIDLLLTVGLNLYVEVLNKKINREINNFKEYSKEIEKISTNNTLDDIINKINIINEYLKNSNLNVNKDLFIDNFIIKFCGGNYD